MFKIRLKKEDASAGRPVPFFADNWVSFIRGNDDFIVSVDGKQVTSLIHANTSNITLNTDGELVLTSEKNGMVTKLELTAGFVHSHDVRFIYIKDGSYDDLKQTLDFETDWGYPLIDFLANQLHSISYPTVAWREDTDADADYEYWFDETDPKDVVIEGDIGNAFWIRLSKFNGDTFKITAITRAEIIDLKAIPEHILNCGIPPRPVWNGLPDGTDSYIIHHSFFRHEGGATEDDD